MFLIKLNLNISINFIKILLSHLFGIFEGSLFCIVANTINYIVLAELIICCSKLFQNKLFFVVVKNNFYYSTLSSVYFRFL